MLSLYSVLTTGPTVLPRRQQQEGEPPAVVLAESAVTVKAAQETRAPATTPERRAETRRDGGTDIGRIGHAPMRMRDVRIELGWNHEAFRPRPLMAARSAAGDGAFYLSTLPFPDSYTK